MDNLPNENDNKKDTSQSQGEIYSDSQTSAYQQAVGIEENTQNESLQPDVNQINQQESVQASTFSPASEDSSGPSGPPGGLPPSYSENKFKKFMILGIIIAFFVLICVFVYMLISSRSNKGTNGQNETIELVYWGLWEEREVMQPIIETYQQNNPNVKINYILQDHKQYRQILQAAIDRGEGPDIFRYHSTWIPMMISSLFPIPDSISESIDFQNTFYPVVTYDLKVGDKYYGVPLMIDGLLLFYNADILEGANVAVPKTWIDVQDAVPKLTVTENGRIVTSAIALGTTDNIEHFSEILALMMLQNGTELTKSLFSCSSPGNTTCGVEALTFYTKFTDPSSAAYTWNSTLENSLVSFAGSKVAMILSPSYEVFTVKALNPSLNFKTAMVPQLPCQTTQCPPVNYANYWVEGVSAKSTHPEEAWQFLNYLIKQESLQKLYQAEVNLRKYFGEPYPRLEMADLLKDNIYLSALIEAAPTMKSFYLVSKTHDGETGINSSLRNYMKAAVESLAQNTSPETALKTADNGFKQVFSRFNISTSE